MRQPTTKAVAAIITAETSRYSCQVADLSSMAKLYHASETVEKYFRPDLGGRRCIGLFIALRAVPELHEVSPTLGPVPLHGETGTSIRYLERTYGCVAARLKASFRGPSRPQILLSGP